MISGGSSLVDGAYNCKRQIQECGYRMVTMSSKSCEVTKYMLRAQRHRARENMLQMFVAIATGDYI